MSKLIFDEATHTYTVDGVPLKSTTQVLAELGVSPSYSGIKQSILDAAAKYGNEVHEREEAAAVGLTAPTPVTDLLPKGQEWGSEIQFYDVEHRIAGTCDLISPEYLIDIKTTAKLHEKSVQLQCSIYAMLADWNESSFGLKNIGVLWLPKKGEPVYKPLELDCKAAITVLDYSGGFVSLELAKSRLIELGYIERPTPIIEGVDELAARYIEIKAKQAALDKELEEVKALVTPILENGGGRHEGLFKATYTSSERKSYDTKKAIEDGINLDAYLKISTVNTLKIS